MSAQTKDYVAHADHLGRVRYYASVIGWRNEDRVTLASAEFPNVGLAKAWAVRETRRQKALPSGSDGPEDVWPEIRRGCWERDLLQDWDYNRTVVDASWIEDGSWWCDGTVAFVDGRIEWCES